jgi:hypothetical protein
VGTKVSEIENKSRNCILQNGLRWVTSKHKKAEEKQSEKKLYIKQDEYKDRKITEEDVESILNLPFF